MEYTARRQRLAQEALEKYGTDRLLTAAQTMMRGQRSDIPDDVEVNYTRAEMMAFIETLDEVGIRRLGQAAAKVGKRRLH
jgi:hypothetical protein